MGTWAINVGGAPAGIEQNFDTPAPPWTDHDWLAVLGMGQAESGGGTIDATCATSQGQSVAATLGRTRDGTTAISQGQSATGTFAGTLASTGTASQGQSATGALTGTLASVLASSQAQSCSGTLGFGFPTQFDGLRFFDGVANSDLSFVAEADAPSGMGGVLKMHKAGTTYALYLVETTDPNASAVRIQTTTGTKAIRKKT